MLLSPVGGRGWVRAQRTSIPPHLASPPSGGEEYEGGGERDLLIQPLARIGMGLDPVPGNVDPLGDPDSVVLLHVVEQPLEADGAAGMADHAHMHADRHHARLSLALAI